MPSRPKDRPSTVAWPLRKPDGSAVGEGVPGPAGATGSQGLQGIQGLQGPAGPPGSGGVWGSLTGTLANQLDLLAALTAKAPLSHTHAPADITGTAVVTADARLSDARTPTAHKASHQAGGGDALNVAGLSGVLADPQPPIIGAGATQAVAGNDARLTNARAPTAHTHPESEVTNLVADLALKAPLASPAFTGTPTGITKAHVGLGNVDNTSDVNKPISTAEQTALNLKANLANPTLAGLTLTDATDVTINATTGSKIGQAGSKMGFFGVAPAVRPTALTQTYATTSAIHAAVTQLVAPAGATGVAAGGWSTAANRDLAIASINAARTDIANLKNFVNQIVDQLQALGLLQ